VKNAIIFFQLICFVHIVCAQVNNVGSYKTAETSSQLLKAIETPPNVDSLKQLLTTNMSNEARAIILFQLTTSYIDNDLDSSLKYIRKFNDVPSKSKQLQANGEIITGDIFLRFGNVSMALEMLFKALNLEADLNDSAGTGMLYWNIGKVYQSLEEYPKAIEYYSKSINIATSEPVPQSFSMGFLGNLYMNLNRLDSALYYTQSAYEIRRRKRKQNYSSELLAQLGDIYQKSGETDLALKYYRTALEEGLSTYNLNAASQACLGIATLFKKDNTTDSCYYYARIGLDLAQKIKGAALILNASDFLRNLFKDQNRLDSAYRYQQIMISARDTLLRIEKIRKVQDISFAEEQRIREIEDQKRDFQNKIELYVLIISLTVFLLIAVILYRNNLQKQKANKVLQATLANLKSTQTQLIQSEKMASLGELTAGIAHEIQNPLNFVNNFSDVNTELLAELNEEMDKGNYDDAKAIAKDVIENEQKINHHGKRADAIVKGMLQHSMSSTGVKEPTDINKLAEEYLRLAYHGLRAKDKSFNATLKTDFDENIGKINIIPQDIGRVLLNLYNNACYAVDEKKKTADKNYDPAVSVSTKKINDKVEIKVADNGNGIPQKIIDKIFQPFFTTKPTGQGTGLGLSLSYDIIKAHGGEIKLETKEGVGTEFIIWLTVNENTL
jgi:two-component system NtrC family sensor kinase